MLMVIPNAGKVKCCDAILDGIFSSAYLCLYKNDYTPVDGSTNANFTQADFSGYSNVAISYSNWPGSTIVSDVAESTLDFVPTFTCDAGPPQTVYGWYIEDGSGNILMAQRFDTPRVMDESVTEKLDPFKFKFKTFA